MSEPASKAASDADHGGRPGEDTSAERAGRTLQSRRRLAAAGLVAAAAAAIAIATATTATNSPGISDGPLEFPIGYGVTLEPIDGGSFFVVEACLAGSAGSASAVAVTEASAEGGEVLVNLSRATKVGAGDVSKMSGDFVPASDVSGQVASCGGTGTWAEFAVVLPPAVSEDKGVDGFWVTYEVDGESYRERIDAALVTCASAPEDPEASACA